MGIGTRGAGLVRLLILIWFYDCFVLLDWMQWNHVRPANSAARTTRVSPSPSAATAGATAGTEVTRPDAVSLSCSAPSSSLYLRKEMISFIYFYSFTFGCRFGPESPTFLSKFQSSDNRPAMTSENLFFFLWSKLSHSQSHAIVL